MNQLTTDASSGMVRPFLRWSGGKQRFAERLLQLFPAPGTYQKYVEPFLGGGSLLLAGDFPEAIGNDHNNLLINAYRQVRDFPMEIFRKLRGHGLRLDRDGAPYYYKVRSFFNAHLDLDPDDPDACMAQAVRFIFLNHSCFNGLYRINKKGDFNVSYGKKGLKLPEQDHLLAVSQRLKGVKLSACSFEEMEAEIGQNSFVYLDPPQLTSGDGFDNLRRPAEWHARLAEFVSRISARGNKVMISMPDLYLKDEEGQSYSPFREWYPDGIWNYHSLTAFRNIRGDRPSYSIGELVLLNYSTK